MRRIPSSFFHVHCLKTTNPFLLVHPHHALYNGPTIIEVMVPDVPSDVLPSAVAPVVPQAAPLPPEDATAQEVEAQATPVQPLSAADADPYAANFDMQTIVFHGDAIVGDNSVYSLMNWQTREFRSPPGSLEWKQNRLRGDITNIIHALDSDNNSTSKMDVDNDGSSKTNFSSVDFNKPPSDFGNDCASQMDKEEIASPFLQFMGQEARHPSPQQTHPMPPHGLGLALPILISIRVPKEIMIGLAQPFRTATLHPTKG
jgi:hypothetical protein